MAAQASVSPGRPVRVGDGCNIAVQHAAITIVIFLLPHFTPSCTPALKCEAGCRQGWGGGASCRQRWQFRFEITHKLGGSAPLGAA